MVQLNLLPDVKKEFIRAQRTKATVIGVAILVTIGSLALTLLLASIVYLVQPGLIKLAQNSINERGQELKGVPEIDKYLTLQNQLESLPGLHGDTEDYSRMFDYLKTLNPAPPNNVRLATLRIDKENSTLSMSGTTGNFRAFSVFEDTLRNATVSYKDENGEKQTVELFEQGGVVVQEQSLSGREGGNELSFTIEAVYNPEPFNPAASDIKLTIPDIRTTQSLTNPQRQDNEPVFEGGS